MRSDPKEGWYVKFPHQQEYKVEPFSEIVTKAIISGQEITKQQYERGDAIFLPYPRLPQRRF